MRQIILASVCVPVCQSVVIHTAAIFIRFLWNFAQWSGPEK